MQTCVAMLDKQYQVESNYAIFGDEAQGSALWVKKAVPKIELDG